MTSNAASIELGTLLDQIRGVKWPARRPVKAGLPGNHRALQKGTSGEFTEFKAYRAGDDPRRIDWRLLARSDRAFVRITDERAWLPTWLLLDASASMSFPDGQTREVLIKNKNSFSVGPSKWEMARSITIGLAFAANATGDPVGLLVASRPDVRIAPRTRRGTVQAIASALERVYPSDNSSIVPALKHVPAGSRIVVCSDLLGDTDSLIAAAAMASAAGSIVSFIHIVHPLELRPPEGVWLVRDPEDVSIRRAMTSEMAKEYVLKYETWRRSVSKLIRSSGASYFEVNCDSDPSREIRRITGSAVGSEVG